MKILIKNMCYFLFRFFPIKDKRILLFSYYGANYGGSPKYISKYITSKDKSYEVIWAFTDINNHKNIQDVKFVKYASIKYLYYLATSKFIITNYRMTNDFHKRKNQKYIQTWHSSLRLKMIEKDAEDTLPEHYLEMAKKDSKQIDMLLAGSRKSKEIYENAFWYEGDYLNCGTPQCDLFFSNNSECTNKVYEYFNLTKDKKVLLYAPTFRKNHDLSAYDIDYNRLKFTLQNRFGGEWVILVRLHPHLINSMNFLKFNDFIMNATQYDDIQELLYVSNIVITDYSALMFDYLLTKKPCFLYTNDYDDYVSNDRKLYFDLNKLPFPICFNNDELNSKLNSFNLEDYQKKCEIFINKEIETWDDGDACKRVFEYIEDNMK